MNFSMPVNIALPFDLHPQPNAAQLQHVIYKLYARCEETAPCAKFPIAPLHRLLEACDLNVCELDELTKLRAMNWLLDCGGLRRAWNLNEEADAQLAGFLYANAAGGCIFVEAQNPVSRRRFSAAHELGHYLLHFLPNLAPDFQHSAQEIEWLQSDGNAANATSASGASTCTDNASPNIAARLNYAHIESEADAFAAELLMPCAVVSEMAATFRASCGDADLVWRLSQQFLVSRKAMWVRLRHLGWLDGAVAYEAVG